MHSNFGLKHGMTIHYNKKNKADIKTKINYQKQQMMCYGILVSYKIKNHSLIYKTISVSFKIPLNNSQIR